MKTPLRQKGLTYTGMACCAGRILRSVSSIINKIQFASIKSNSPGIDTLTENNKIAFQLLAAPIIPKQQDFLSGGSSST